jgi:hypothetical protein
MNKHIKLFEQFVSEAVTFDKFVDFESILGGNNGYLKINLEKSFTVKDKDGESVISEEGIFIEQDGMVIMMSDEGSYEAGETLSASFNLSLLKGLSLDLAKAKMGPDFKNLKVEGGILTFEYIIPADFNAKNKKFWGGGTKTTGMDKFREVLKGGVEKVIKTLEGKRPSDEQFNFCIIIPCPNIEEYGYLSITMEFQPDTQISK